MAPIAPRHSRPSGRKNAHRGLAARCGAASGESRSQARAASGKNRHSPTTARRVHLLPQGNAPSTTLQPIVITPSYALPDTGAVQQAGFAGLDFLGAQFLSYVQGEILRAFGCKSAVCGVLATVVIAAVTRDPEAAGTTTLYRAVSPAEYADISESGVLRAGPNSFESGKWFAQSPQDATAWGNAFHGPGNFSVIQVQFPFSTADQFFTLGSLDGIGPAQFGTFDQIGNPQISLWTGQ